MQIAQTPQEGVKSDLERGSGIALAGLVAALQIGAGAERAPRPRQDEATDLGFLVVDSIERLGETAEHVHGDRIHHLLMIELQDGYRTVNVERDALELHFVSS